MSQEGFRMFTRSLCPRCRWFLVIAATILDAPTLIRADQPSRPSGITGEGEPMETRIRLVAHRTIVVEAMPSQSDETSEPVSAPTAVPEKSSTSEGGAAKTNFERPIGEIRLNVTPPVGSLPKNSAAERFASKDHPKSLRPWELTPYCWNAPNLFYRSLYYEDPNLERLGYSACRPLQPAISGVKFMADTLALPYHMTLHSPCECISPLGYERPGSPAPFRMYLPECDARAAAVQAGTVLGLIAIIP
jgi:hypothetical protein